MRSILLLSIAWIPSTAAADASEPAASTTGVAAEVAPARPASFALPARRFAVALTLEIESSADRLAEPVTLAPDATYGVTDELSISVVHSKFAVTGFRAVTGGGVCLDGDDAACPHLYNNVGAEALYAVRSGPLAIAAVAGMHALDLDNGFYDAKLGAKLRYSAGRASVVAMPSVLIALTERTDEMGARRNKDLYYLPVLASYQAAPAFALGLGTGIKGALHDLGGSWELPVGVVATYAIDRRITVGASFVFGKLLGGADDPPAPAPPATGPDYRGTQAWVVFTP